MSLSDQVTRTRIFAGNAEALVWRTQALIESLIGTLPESKDAQPDSTFTSIMNQLDFANNELEKWLGELVSQIAILEAAIIGDTKLSPTSATEVAKWGAR